MEPCLLNPLRRLVHSLLGTGSWYLGEPLHSALANGCEDRRLVIDANDDHVGPAGGLDRLVDAVQLEVHPAGLLDLDIVTLFDIEGVMGAMGHVVWSVADYAQDAEAVGEVGVLNVLDLDAQVHAAALGLLGPDHVGGPLLAAPCDGVHHVARLNQMAKVPKVVPVLDQQLDRPPAEVLLQYPHPARGSRGPAHP